MRITQDSWHITYCMPNKTNIHIYIYNKLFHIKKHIYIYIYLSLNIIMICIYNNTIHYVRSPVGGSLSLPQKTNVSQSRQKVRAAFFWSVADTFCCHSGQDKDPGTNASLSAIFISVPLLQSFLYNCKALNPDGMPGFVQCCSSGNLGFLVFGRIPSTEHTAQTHIVFDPSKPEVGSIAATGYKKLALGLFNLSVFFVGMDLQTQGTFPELACRREDFFVR